MVEREEKKSQMAGTAEHSQGGTRPIMRIELKCLRNVYVMTPEITVSIVE